MISECGVCISAVVPDNATGGPHGLHPIGADWVEHHNDEIEDGNSVACRSCHGSDVRGTVLSRTFANRSFSTDFGTDTFWRGFQVSCFSCHNGPNSEVATTNHAAHVANASAETTAGASVAIPLAASDADGDPLVLRVVSQPEHGTVGLVDTTATFYAEPKWSGVQSFTFAANDGKTDSNLGTASVTIPEPGAATRALAAALALAVLRVVPSRRRPQPSSPRNT
jgi:hypothetical protein